MPDNLKKQKLDRKHIALSQKHERQYWTQTLKVDIPTIRRAIKAVGSTSARMVRAHLAKK